MSVDTSAKAAIVLFMQVFRITFNILSFDALAWQGNKSEVTESYILFSENSTQRLLCTLIRSCTTALCPASASSLKVNKVVHVLPTLPITPLSWKLAVLHP